MNIHSLSMNRRSFLQTAACVPAGLFLTGNGLAQALGLWPGNVVQLRCLGNIEGPRFLDGHTADGTVGLAPNIHPPYTGASWQVVDAGQGAIALRCLAEIGGPRFLDGHTADGTVGLAVNTRPPYTGTSWQVMDAGQGAIALRCLGDVGGPRFLDGHTADGTVGLALNTHLPYTGTRWAVF